MVVIVKKSALSLTAALLAVLCLSGCSSGIYDREYMAMSEHSELSENGLPEQQIVAEVADSNELREACLNMIHDYVRYGIICFPEDYDGNPAIDVPMICEEVSSRTSLGIYATNQINYAVMQRKSGIEAEISIDFKKTLQQIRTIQYTGSQSDVDELLYSSLRSAEKGVIFCSEQRNIDEEYVKDVIEKYYFGDATLSAFEPIVTAEVYMGFDNEIIVEVNFGRRYSRTRTLEMRDIMIDEAEKYLREYENWTTGYWLLHTCDKLGNSVRHIDIESAYTRTVNDNTAYGALVEKKAVSEGFAMAYKAICDLNNVECYVVHGSKDGRAHCWNIVALDSDYYHVDVSVVRSEGIYKAFLKKDSTLGDEYEWDRNAYPECDGEATYYDFMPERDEY